MGALGESTYYLPKKIAPTPLSIMWILSLVRRPFLGNVFYGLDWFHTFCADRTLGISCVCFGDPRLDGRAAFIRHMFGNSGVLLTRMFDMIPTSETRALKQTVHPFNVHVPEPCTLQSAKTLNPKPLNPKP